MASENQKLKKKLWTAMSQYIRQRDADWQGMVACCSCGKVKHYKEMDCGHYHPRTDGLAMFFEEKNLAPQCSACNRFRHGNLARYAIYLIGKYGNGILEELEWKSRQRITISNTEYKRLIGVYKDKINSL